MYTHNTDCPCTHSHALLNQCRLLAHTQLILRLQLVYRSNSITGYKNSCRSCVVNIILDIFMFYKQRVLADFWSRKDSAVDINKMFIAHSMCTALRLRLAQIGVLFGCQNAIFVKRRHTWECWLIMFRVRVCVRHYIGKCTVIMAKLRWVGILHKWRYWWPGLHLVLAG